MALPTRQDICPHGDDDLDGQSACRNFLGKTVDEAEALFRRNDTYYQEDLMYMGPVAFRFYFPAAVQYVRSDPTETSDFVAHLASTLEFRLDHEPKELIPIAEQLAVFCTYVDEHASKFQDGWDGYYGDVRSRYQALKQAFLSLVLERGSEALS